MDPLLYPHVIIHFPVKMSGIHSLFTCQGSTYPHVMDPLPYQHVRDPLPCQHSRYPPIHMSGIQPSTYQGSTSLSECQGSTSLSTCQGYTYPHVRDPLPRPSNRSPLPLLYCTGRYASISLSQGTLPCTSQEVLHSISYAFTV
jgi:hypothetical protein